MSILIPHRGDHRNPGGRRLFGHFTGIIATTTVDHASLLHTLPERLTTDRAKYAEKHPLILMIGRQSNVSPELFGLRIPVPSAGDYREACVLIPDLRVVSRDSTTFEVVTYFARLYLDRIVPTFVGRWPYGWNKCLASFREENDSLSLFRSRKGRLLTLSPKGKVEPAGPICAELRRRLDQPTVIGRGTWLRPVTFRFNWEGASVRKQGLSTSLGKHLLIGVEEQNVDSGSENCDAFQVSADWSLRLSSAWTRQQCPTNNHTSSPERGILS